MATARVKVDDLAVGNLLWIGAKTGVSADGFIDEESGHGGLPSWWSSFASFAVLVAGIAASVGFRDTWTWAPDPGLVGLVTFGVGPVVAIISRLWIDAELDGSGRWAASTGVHWLFADAVETRYRQASVDPAR